MQKITRAREQVELLAGLSRLAYDIQSPAPGEPMRTKRGPMQRVKGQPSQPIIPQDPANDPMAHLDKRPYDYNTMVDNLVSHYNGANDNERKQGRFWYKAAHDLFHTFAKKNGISPERAVAMGAAFSPLTDWGDNVNHAQSFMLGYTPDDPRAVESGLFNEHDWQMSHIAQEPLDAFRQKHKRNPTDSDEDLHELADLHQGKWRASQAEIKKGLPGKQDIANNPEARQKWMENIQHHGIDTVLADQARQSEAWVKDKDKKGLYNPQYAMRAAGINTLGGNIQKAKNLMHAPDDIVAMFKVLGGPKISHFTDNILDDTEIDQDGYYQHPNGDWTQNKDLGGTIDSHHMRAAGMAHGQWEHKPYSVKNPSTNHEYDVYNRGLYEATRRINEAQPDRRKHITPKQLQAIVWLKHKNDKDYFERQRNPLTNKPIVHESELGSVGRPEDWQFADKSYKSRGKAAALDENDFASMPPLWREMFMSRHHREWTDLLAAWVEHHAPDVDPTQITDREIQAARRVLAWVNKLAGGGYDNPWEGPDAEDLGEGCPYCDADSFDMHQVDCPSLYTDTPGIDKKLLGPSKWEVPFAEHPSFRLNSIIAFADRVLNAALQQRPMRPGEAPQSSADLWKRPVGLSEDFNPFDGYDPDEENY